MPDAVHVTEVEYNSYKFGLVKTASMSSIPIMDSSGLDMIGIENRLTITFLLALRDRYWEDFGVAVGPDLFGEDFEFDPETGDWNLDPDIPKAPASAITKVYRRLKRILQVPRRPLVIKRGGEVVFDSKTNPNSGYDSADEFHGPFPGELSVVSPVSNRTWILQWSVTWKTYNGRDYINYKDVPTPISVRYDQEQSWDDRGYSTISTTGELRATAPIFRGEDPAVSLASIDSLRHYTLPKLLPGYQRRSRFKVSRDGLSLQFSFHDQELDTCPPEPAYKADGHYAVFGSGAIWHAEVSVSLSGKKGTSKQKLLELAVAICLSRVNAVSKGSNLGAAELWQTMFAKAHGGVSIKESLFDNQIAVSMRFLVPPANVAGNAAAVLSTAKSVAEEKGFNANPIRAAAEGAVLSIPGAGIIASGPNYMNAVRSFLFRSSEEGHKYAQQGNKLLARGLISMSPLGELYNIYRAVSDTEEAIQQAEQEKAEAVRISTERRDSQAGAAMVPRVAWDAIGNPLPGVSQYRPMDAGGIRGGTDAVPVLLVAGFMRDPAVNLDPSTEDLLGSGVRGPVIPKDSYVTNYPDPAYTDGVSGVAPPQKYEDFAANIQKIKQLRGWVFNPTLPGVDALDFGYWGDDPNDTMPWWMKQYGMLASLAIGTSQFTATTTGFTLGETMEVEYSEESLSYQSRTDLVVKPPEIQDVVTPYTQYYCVVDYQYKGKDLVAYPTYNTGNAVRVQVYTKPLAQVVVRFSAERIGQPPAVPFNNINDTDSNLVFRRANISAPQVDLNDDGSYLYKVNGIVVYDVLDSDKLALRPPVPPWLAQDMEQFAAAAFVEDELQVDVNDAN